MRWTHEEGSTMLFQDMVESHPILAEQLSKKQVQEICNLILGDKPEGDTQRPWLFEIVSNSRNGIDVDKFDYLCRDAMKINVNHNSFNHDIVMQGARVIDDQICYPEKYEFELKKMYTARYNMHQDVYQHKTTTALELIVVDILKETEGILYNYLEVIHDPKQYIELDDTILHEIRVSDDPRLAKAQELLQKYDRRELYSCVGEKGINLQLAKKLGKLSEQDIINAATNSGNLRAEDIAISWSKKHFGMKEKNPLSEVSFYRILQDGSYEKFNKNP